MPVRLRITLYFVFIVSFILLMVCSGIYYFFYKERIETVKTRLTNRAITTGRLLAQREVFNDVLVKRIDSLTTISLKEKVILAYNDANQLIYSYSTSSPQPFTVTTDLLNTARAKKSLYFEQGSREAVAYHFSNGNQHVLMIAAGVDEDGKRSLKTLLNILALAFLIGTVFILYSGFIFSKMLLEPVKKITADVAEISAQNLARRIETGAAKDEWFNLSQTLNDLLNRLQQTFELQRRFISNASHELTTPLTSISSQLQVTLQREREAEEYRKVMESVYQDVRHMSKLTQTLLEFAKAAGSAGGLEINLIRLDEILMNLPAEMGKIDRSYAVTLHFESLPEEDEQLLVFGNEPLLFTAIKNIVLNACKYSADHKARVEFQSHEQLLTIKVIDRGPGISEEEKSKIFQPFYRVEENRAEGGFGLGLSLADRIIRMHKGSIAMESESGQGTIFTISLPAARSLEKIALQANY